MSSFAAIEQVAEVMDGFPAPWFVSGGWAIDLFVGRVTREHQDREVGIFRRDQTRLHEHLAAWDLCWCKAGPEGAEWVPWTEGDWVEAPFFQIRARKEEGEPTEFELFLNDTAGAEWVCKRDASITRRAETIYLQSSLGIPFLAPEIQLLYKAKRHRPQDEHDFRTARPLLNPAQRDWLKMALQIVHPGDPWLAGL